MPISKKTVLITGCSDGGIGAAMTRILRGRDYYVFATLRNTSKARTLGELSDVEILQLDVTSKDSITRCAEHARERTGGTLDMLINNASQDFLMPLLDVDIDEGKKFFDVNFWGVLAVTQAFAPMIIKAKGVVVTHSSIVWNLAIAWGGMYSTSKAAVKHLSEVLRVELEPLGVRVVTAIVGAVDTRIFANSHPGELQIPSASYYEPIRQFLVDARAGKLQPKMEHVDVTAQRRVNDILGGAKGCVWRGAMLRDARWLSGWLPDWILDIMNNGTRGITELRHYYIKES